MVHGQGWIGRKDRPQSSVEATACCADGAEVAVTITNLSDEGCRIESAHTFVIGERLRLAVPGIGSMTAQVRWALLGAAGARFITNSSA